MRYFHDFTSVPVVKLVVLYVLGILAHMHLATLQHTYMMHDARPIVTREWCV